MTKKELGRQYFDWMIHKIRNKDTHRYKNVLELLHTTTFTYLIDLDENRYVDGVELRYRFAENTDLDYSVIDLFLKKEPCSVLEMMVALALRCEEQIMDNSEEGNRMSVWFWDMVDSLGLGHMTDRQYNDNYTKAVVNKFLKRQYQTNGDGGLFTVRYAKQDMRNVEIWYQACIYLNEYIARREKKR